MTKLLPNKELCLLRIDLEQNMKGTRLQKSKVVQDRDRGFAGKDLSGTQRNALENKRQTVPNLA